MSQQDNSALFAHTLDNLINGDDRQVSTNTAPLQMPGQDDILRTYTLGGPDCNRDVRMFLTLGDLEELVKQAKASESKRVVLHKAGIQIVVRRSHGGHVYETLHLTSLQPQPERLPKGVQFSPAPMVIDQWQQRGILKPGVQR